MSNIDWDLAPLIAGLKEQRQRWRKARQRDPDEKGREFPSVEVLQEVVQGLTEALFPMRLGPWDLHARAEDHFIGYTLDRTLSALHEQAMLELRCCADRYDSIAERRDDAARIVHEFSRQLPQIRGMLDLDVEAAFKGDPAARNMDEVLLCYPGVHAIIYHRLAHALFQLGLPLTARIIAEISHSDTGIDIHPGATIGESFFIDHGTGVVVGETCIIGARVRLYQAVTLGAKRFDRDEDGELLKGYERHPVVEDDVVIYAGATLLGRVTIGKGSIIGGNVWLTHSVPANSVITQADSEEQ